MNSTLHKPRIRVVDVPVTATAAEVEALVNAPYADGYYSDHMVVSNLPEGVGSRFFYKLRVKPERAQ